MRAPRPRPAREPTSPPSMRGGVATSVADRPLRLGTRGSALALAQANVVAKALGGAEVVPIKTSDNASKGGDKARFVREIAGVPEREDPRDAYVGHVDSIGEVPKGSRIGTSSLRRRAQLLARRPDL